MVQKMTERKYTVTAHMKGAVAPINMQTEATDFAKAAEWAINFGKMSGFAIVGVKETATRTPKAKEE